MHWRQQVEAELRRTDEAEPQRKGRVTSDRHSQHKHSTDELQRDRQEEKTGRGERYREGRRKMHRNQGRNGGGGRRENRKIEG